MCTKYRQRKGVCFWWLFMHSWSSVGNVATIVVTMSSLHCSVRCTSFIMACFLLLIAMRFLSPDSCWHRWSEMPSLLLVLATAIFLMIIHLSMKRWRMHIVGTASIRYHVVVIIHGLGRRCELRCSTTHSSVTLISIIIYGATAANASSSRACWARTTSLHLLAGRMNLLTLNILTLMVVLHHLLGLVWWRNTVCRALPLLAIVID